MVAVAQSLVGASSWSDGPTGRRRPPEKVRRNGGLSWPPSRFASRGCRFLQRSGFVQQPPCGGTSRCSCSRWRSRCCFGLQRERGRARAKCAFAVVTVRPAGAPERSLGPFPVPEEGSCPSCCSTPPAAVAHRRRCPNSMPAARHATRGCALHRPTSKEDPSPRSEPCFQGRRSPVHPRRSPR